KPAAVHLLDRWAEVTLDPDERRARRTHRLRQPLVMGGEPGGQVVVRPAVTPCDEPSERGGAHEHAVDAGEEAGEIALLGSGDRVEEIEAVVGGRDAAVHRHRRVPDEHSPSVLEPRGAYDHPVETWIQTELDSGERVISERLPHVRSATIGYWIGV